MMPPVILPALANCSWINLPNRLELLLYTVLALPNASMMGLQKEEKNEKITFFL